MGVNNYQTILRIELNDQICYSEHHLMVPEHFYCWVAGSFNQMCTLGQIFSRSKDTFIRHTKLKWQMEQLLGGDTGNNIEARIFHET